jgi:thiosulfate dehydrogenase (quinone) large subunit
MSILNPPRTELPAELQELHEEQSRAPASTARYAWAVARLSIGWLFLWSFLDKAFGLGFATERADAWINGGSPTFGYLNFGTQGPFASTFQSVAGATWMDWLFMTTMLGVGLALILGIGMRIAAASGVLFLASVWVSAMLPEFNPFMDEHLVYSIVLVGLALTRAGDTWGLGGWWGRTPLVRRYPILR